jgi:hypothetical protein
MNFPGSEVGVGEKVAVGVGEGVNVCVGVGVFVAVAVGVKVIVAVGVAVGSGANNPPRPQAKRLKLDNSRRIVKNIRFVWFIISSLRATDSWKIEWLPF